MGIFLIVFFISAVKLQRGGGEGEYQESRKFLFNFFNFLFEGPNLELNLT